MSEIEVPVEDSCAFCAYLSGRRPYVFLWRSETVAVAVTREQRGVSHLLVMTVAHVPTLVELPDGLARDLMLAVRDAAITIDAAENRPGIAVWQNNGVPAGQAIPHLHLHVAGTLPGGGTEFGDVAELSLDETKTIATRLAPHVIRHGTDRRVFEPLTQDCHATLSGNR